LDTPYQVCIHWAAMYSSASEERGRSLLDISEKVSQRPQTDCLWFSVEEPDQGIQAIGDIIQKLLPQLGFDPTNDVQLLAPMTRGSVGTRNLNTVLQNLINPAADDKPCLQWGSTTFRVGDRVIQLKNDYDQEVFNGDLGIVRSIDVEEQEMLIGFGERLVKFDYADLNELGLAWACTTHKAQGSEYPVVVLPIFMQHYVMLTRNLFYTALTRARKLAIIVGSQKAIALAIVEKPRVENLELDDVSVLKGEQNWGMWDSFSIYSSEVNP